MKKIAAFFVLSICFGHFLLAENPDTPISSDSIPNKKAISVKIEGQISSPQSAILKRAMRKASRENADALIIDINTPGGDIGTTLEMMEMLSDFKGETICYINTDAISAGSFIAVACKKIIFSPKGVSGAAEAVNSGGGDIDESMKRKITSFISAKVRSLSDGRERRASVQRAMNDPDFELTIGGKTIKKRGELLTLTAKEAAEKIDGYSLFSDGTAQSLQAAVDLALCSKNVHIEKVDKTWADEIAIGISGFAPIIMGLAFFLIIIDIKSGSFGMLATGGIALILLVFLGVNLTGISGHEEILAFVAGAALIAVEIFFLPGTFVFAGIGILCVVGALAWALGDIWPSRDIASNAAAFGNGFIKVAEAMVLCALMLLLFGKYFNKTPIWRKMVLSKQTINSSADNRKKIDTGKIGISIVDLKPSGLADFDGEICEVQSQFGEIPRGTRVEIVEKKDFTIIVKHVE